MLITIRYLNGHDFQWSYDLTDIFNNTCVVICYKNDAFSFLFDRYNSEEPKYDYKNPGFSREAGHFTQVRYQLWGLMVSGRDSRSRGGCLRHCVVFLGKTLNCHSDSHHPGV